MPLFIMYFSTVYVVSMALSLILIKINKDCGINLPVFGDHHSLIDALFVILKLTKTLLMKLLSL